MLSKDNFINAKSWPFEEAKKIIERIKKTGKKEVIDGQQRLTTLMLLLRAFYVKFGNMQDKQSLATKKNIEQCIWKTNEFGEPDMDALKIDSEVATDNDKEEFLNINVN